jgi:serine O-acetyltransferase
MHTVEKPTDPPRGEQGEQEWVAPTFRSVLRGRDFFASARRLWLLSVVLHRSGHPRLGRIVKNINGILYHNSLSSQVRLSADIALGHHGMGTVIHPKVVIGSKVKIFQNVTMAVRPPTGSGQIVIEDNAVVGAGAVIMTPSKRSVRIGFGARGGAGAVVTNDVPARMNAMSAPVVLRPRRNHESFKDQSPEDES